MFKGEKHKKRFLNEIELLKNQNSHFNKRFLSALYIITSDEFLWNVSKDHIEHNKIKFEQIDIRGINSLSYQLWQISKSLLSKEEISVNELLDKELFSDKNFKIIIDAIKIARKGLNL